MNKLVQLHKNVRILNYKLFRLKFLICSLIVRELNVRFQYSLTDKIVPLHAMKAYGIVEVYFYALLTLVPDWVSG